MGEDWGRGVGGGGWRPGLGGEHTVQGTDDALQNGTPDTYVILLTSGTPTNSIKKILLSATPLHEAAERATCGAPACPMVAALPPQLTA